MTSMSKRLAVPVACTGLAVFMLPWGGTAQAESVVPYSGYTSLATASPLVIEIYEPTIPIPHTPEFEMQFAYTKVLADSSSTKSRASFVWPGDPVGEGLKTFIEQLGLPPSLGKAGYPVQVNSGFPSGPARQSQAPVPGGFMKTSAEDGKASASTYRQRPSTTPPAGRSKGSWPARTFRETSATLRWTATSTWCCVCSAS